jgi:hypothetical protein
LLFWTLFALVAKNRPILDLVALNALCYTPPFDSKKEKKAPKLPLNSQFEGFVICQKNLA